MQKRNHRFQRRATIRLLVGSCLALTLALLFFPFKVSAHTVIASATEPTFSVNLGFNSRYRDGNWTPVQVTLQNNGPEFSGTVSINVPSPYLGNSAGNSLASIYQMPISLPTGAQKQVTLYVPFNLGSQGLPQNITVDLLDSNGQKVSSQNGTLRSLGSNDVFVGILSDQFTGFGPLNAVPLPSQGASLVQEQLSTATLPDLAEVLKNFDFLVLDNFTTSTLSKGQLAALQGWVNQGGSLLVVGGPEWRRTLSPLPTSLQPVTTTGTTTLPAGTRLLPISGPASSNAVADTVQISGHRQCSNGKCREYSYSCRRFNTLNCPIPGGSRDGQLPRIRSHS